jgi:hypothetical protein
MGKANASIPQEEGGGGVLIDQPQIGDIWEYTFDPNVLPQYKDEYKTVCHVLILDVVNRHQQLCLGYFMESGYTSEIVMQESRNMKYRKIA